MGKPVYMVSGSKGGVGKSIVSMSLIHYLSKRDEKLLLIDADTANPDVGKAYGKWPWAGRNRLHSPPACTPARWSCVASNPLTAVWAGRCCNWRSRRIFCQDRWPDRCPEGKLDRASCRTIKQRSGG